MDLLRDELPVPPPALSLLGAYADAIAAAATAAAPAGGDPDDAGDAAGDAAGDDAGGGAAGAAGPRRVVSVPRLSVFDPGGAGGGGEPTADAADLHGVLLAAGALDVDLSDVAAGVRYQVTRHGRALLKKAA